MRVTAETKAATRSNILDAARQLFKKSGFDATTTRDIARDANVAHGTLFNYFANKEAMLACLASDAVAVALSQFHANNPTSDSLEEHVFSLIATELRKLKPLRKHLPFLLETSLSPLANSDVNDSASFRLSQLEAVARLAVLHGYRELSSVALQLYWTLYTGILVFWANDKSPKQEDTLALIDHSLNMFVGWLGDPHESQNTDPKS